MENTTYIYKITGIVEVDAINQSQAEERLGLVINHLSEQMDVTNDELVEEFPPDSDKDDSKLEEERDVE